MRNAFRSLLWWCLRVNSLWVLQLGRLLYHLDIHGREYLPTTGPLLIVSRHSSRIEIFRYAFLCSVFKAWHAPAAGPELIQSRVFAWLSRELGMLPARSVSTGTLMQMFQLLRQGKVILVMADGEVPWDGRAQPLRPGAAWLALRAHVPVVAILLQGAYDIWPRWAPRPHLTGKLQLCIGRPFYLSDVPYERVTSKMIREANGRLQAELAAVASTFMAQTAWEWT